MRLLHENINRILSPSDRVECSLSGMLFVILKLMDIEPKSPLLQSLGLDCFYSLIGSHLLHEIIPIHFSETHHHSLLSCDTRAPIVTTLVSVGSSPGNWLRKLRDGMECVVKYYNMKNSDEDEQ